MSRRPATRAQRGPIPGVSDAAARQAARIVTLNRGFDEPPEDVLEPYQEIAGRVRSEDRDW